ncbi:VanZ like family protein [Caprobacter fermentans]|uniref:VanZ like family protein n=2 Tax=Caproicibacter fermentans TaxID=2576756 RepID=A0A6N8I491_9FIRM|nr:VanZ like family protein [Caproicibacter fermentans]
MSAAVRKTGVTRHGKKRKDESMKRKGLVIATVGFVLFIFHNSMFPASQSGEQSRFVTDLANNALSKMRIPAAVSEHMIRKTAHFAEYFVSGTLMTATLRAYRSAKRELLFADLFFLLLVPVCDEFIQRFVPGRGSSVSDVLLDFCGGVTGMLILLFARRQAKS